MSGIVDDVLKQWSLEKGSTKTFVPTEGGYENFSLEEGGSIKIVWIFRDFDLVQA